MDQEVQPAWQVIPLLAQEWLQDPAATMEKFHQFIRWHESKGHALTVCLYRSALVQLKHGYSVQVLTGLGFDDKRLRQEAGA